VFWKPSLAESVRREESGGCGIRMPSQDEWSSPSFIMDLGEGYPRGLGIYHCKEA
jgi:hypothetical protein